MPDTTYKLREIQNDARAELRDRWANYRDEFYQGEPHDVIHEIADSSVPVYTSDLLEMAAADNYLATNEPELGPAFDGSPTPTNIIASNVYEAVTEALWEEWREIQSEDDSDEEDASAV